MILPSENRVKNEAFIINTFRADVFEDPLIMETSHKSYFTRVNDK